MALAVAISCCSCSKQIQMSMYHDKDYPDNSFDYAVTTSLGSDSIPFGTSRINNAVLSYLSKDGDTLHAELWLPAGKRYDTSSLLILIPGYEEHTTALYPFALSATRAGFPVVLISARGLDMNAQIKRDFYFKELQDISDAIDEYAKDEGIKNIKVGAFGYSLGAVLALNLAYRDSRVHAAALESIVMDPISSASKVMKGRDYDTLMELVNAHPEIHSFSTGEILPHWVGRKTPLMFIWGADDNVVLKPERDSITALAQLSIPNVPIEVVPNGGHVMRYGFPLSASQAISLNDSISGFFIKSLRY
jgi:dipeptidyl aminopeptidase/acylaminoacyl peptidase